MRDDYFIIIRDESDRAYTKGPHVRQVFHIKAVFSDTRGWLWEVMTNEVIGPGRGEQAALKIMNEWAK